MNSDVGFRVGLNFWGTRCDVEVGTRRDAEHLAEYFAENGGFDSQPDITIRLLANGRSFIHSLLDDTVTKEIQVRVSNQEWKLWDRFKTRSNQRSPIPPLTLPPLQGTVSAFHAAAVAPPQRLATLLAGPSFSGKSVLTLALMLRGWECLTDDLAVFSHADNVVLPFRRPIGVRENTLSLLPDLKTRLAQSDRTVIQLNSGLTWMVRPESITPAPPPEPRKLAHIVFLDACSPDQNMKLSKLSLEQGERRIAALLRTPSSYSPSKQMNVTSWSLSFNLETQAMAAVGKIIELNNS